MLLYLNSERKFSVNSVLEIPPNIVLFQELTSAKRDKKTSKATGHSYQIICDIQIHDPLLVQQSEHVYRPMKNGLFADHESGGLTKEEFIKRITNGKSSRSIFSTLVLLEQIKSFGFDAVFIFEGGRREVVVVKGFDAQVIKRI